MRRRLLALAVLVALASTPAAAADIARRKVRQQARIGAGVATGTLSPQEAGRLQTQEAALDHEEHAMREANGGRLTLPERRVLSHQQNRLSRRIFVQKHDGNNE